MPDLTVFGGCLRSELTFPELRSAATSPSWTLRLIDVPPSLAGAEALGDDEVDAGIRVRSFRRNGAYVLDYDDTGIFVITDGGRAISYWPKPGAREASARLDVLGRVIPMALHAEGLLTLHGSGVAIGDRAIGFLAPKYFGKSSIAFALVSAGAKLITDDALAVTLTPRALARPGVHCVRLFSDSATRLGAQSASTSSTLGKVNLDALPDEKRMQAPAPLDAIYLLAPVENGADVPAASRTPMDSVLAALSLIRHAKLAPLLGGSEAPLLFDRATALARAVPVYALHVARDLERLPDAARILAEWHAPGGAAP